MAGQSTFHSISKEYNANSEVFINGNRWGASVRIYIILVRLTRYLDFEKKMLLLSVWTMPSRSIAGGTSGSGIYRHVWLSVTSPVHVVQWGTSITTLDIGSGKASVRARTLVKK